MAKTPQACGCGCGGMTKGGRFLPGHDARFHAAQKAGRLAGAIAHATGAHGTAGKAAPVSTGYQRPVADERPGDEPPKGEGTLTAPKGTRGTPVSAGMWVRATVNGKPEEGIVFSVDPFGNIAFVKEDGRQSIGYPGMTWVMDTNTKRRPNPQQRATLERIDRAVPGMQTGGKQ